MKKLAKHEQKLVEENIGLVAAIVRKFHPRSNHDLEDWVQQGTLFMIDAIKMWDPQKGKLSTIIWWCVYRGIRRYIEKATKNQFESKYAEKIDESWEDNSKECLPDSLSKKEKKVIELRLTGHTYKKIGKRYRRNPQWASKTFKEAVSKINPDDLIK